MKNRISHKAGFMINALVDRSSYPSLNDCVYLNQASLGLIGQPAVQSMHEFLDNTARHGNLRMTDEEEVGFFESLRQRGARPVSYTHLRAHETRHDLVCRLLL